MKCYICTKKLEQGYLCKEHTEVLMNMLENDEGIIKNPDWRYHCQICGEYNNRVIVEYHSIGYFCDIDIREEFYRYESIKS